MQMKNKLLASLLCLGLLTGCGNNTNEQEASQKAPFETSQEEVKEEREENKDKNIKKEKKQKEHL